MLFFALVLTADDSIFFPLNIPIQTGVVSAKLLVKEDPGLYHFINQGCLTVDGMDDKEEMRLVDVCRKGPTCLRSLALKLPSSPTRTLINFTQICTHF